MFDFPNSPINGQSIAGPGGVQYRWDGMKWVSVQQFGTSINSAGIFNVRDYGAKGDGVTDDTVAFQAALNALAASATGGVIYIPEADYKITAQLTVTISTHRLTIRSDGTHGARLHFTNSASAGIAITINPVPSGVWLSGGSSIHIEHITGVIDWTATSAGRFISITTNRGSLNRPMPPSIVIKRVAGIATDDVAGWANLVYLQDCIICYLSEIWNWCSTSDTIGNTVTIKSTAQWCVSFRIDRLRQQRGGTALVVTDFIQGVYVHEMETVNAQQSISWTNPLGGSGADNLIVTNSQLNSVLGEIVTDRVDSVEVSNCYLLAGGNRNWTGISISNGSRHTITGNTFTSSASGGDTASCAVNLSNVASGATITGNHTFGLTGNSAAGAPIMLLNGTHGVIASGNALSSGTIVGYVDGTSTSNNAWGNVISAGVLVAIGFSLDNAPFIVGSNSSSSGAKLNINGMSGTSRGVMFQTTSLSRWQVLVDNAAETGSNAGGNFVVQRYDDSGASLGTPLSISRPTGLVSAPVGLIVGSTSSTSADVQFNGAASTFRLAAFLTAGSQRWRIGADATAEAGSNEGSDFGFRSYNDAGGFIGVPLSIKRATGLATFSAGMAVSSAGPTIRAGTGAATGTQPAGSLWLRTDGSIGNRMYVSQGGGTWVAIAGV